MRVLVIDISGIHVKVLATGHGEVVDIASRPKMTPAKTVAAPLLKKLPPNTRLGDNANAFQGGYRLWSTRYRGFNS